MVKITDNEFEISADEIRGILDTEAKKRLGLSGDELLRRYDAGEIADPSEIADLLILADLLMEPQPA
jgi:uncharacterized protein YehS (DUF1456 family)